MLETILVFLFIGVCIFILWDYYDDKRTEKEMKQILEFWEKQRQAYDDKLGKAKKYLDERVK